MTSSEFPLLQLNQEIHIFTPNKQKKKKNVPNHLLCSLYLLTMKEMKTSVLTNKYIMLSNNAQQQKNF